MPAEHAPLKLSHERTVKITGGPRHCAGAPLSVSSVKHRQAARSSSNNPPSDRT